MRETPRAIAERKKGEEALRQSERRLRQAVRVSHLGIFDHDHLTDTICWSPEQREIYGLGPDEVVTMALYFDHVYAEDREVILEAVGHAHDPAGDGLFDIDHRITRRDGSIRWLTTRSQTFFEGEGAARHKVRTIGAVLDITERKRTEDALHEAETRFRGLVEQSPVGIYILCQDGKFSYVNPAMAWIFKYEQEEMLSLSVLDLAVDKEHTRAAQVIRELMEGIPQPYFTFRFRRKDGILIDVEVHGTKTEFQGKPALIGTMLDITERRRAEQALREAEEKYREIFDNAVLGIFQSTPEGRYLSINQAMARMHGYASPGEMMATITDIEHQQYADPSRCREFMRLLEEQNTARNFEYEICRKDSSRGWALLNARAIRDEQGKVVYYEGTQEDITVRKHLEAQYQQAQKMEAVGHLAGGIAHDFNNILNVIMGYTELSSSLLDEKHPVARNISQIRQAAERAANLTKQLLAFSRQQIAYPRVLDLNKVVENLSEMLKRLVGEDVVISFTPGERLGLIRADVGQIEQILMNLGANARDAMPRGGEIIIETCNITLDDNQAQQPAPAAPGPYVMLSFRDTGSGIDKETLPRIFEPFFTTKGPTKGTGLGLSTVYGIVKQSNGHIWASSEPNKGTIFKICFPLVEENESVPDSESETDSKGGSETLLLVEDEAALREVAASMLETVGYKVLKAENAGAALALAQACTGEIDLVITDVIMPNMSGVELCGRLRELRPGVGMLYISGFTGDQLQRYAQFASDVTLLEKPFTKKSLLKKVRSVLDS